MHSILSYLEESAKLYNHKTVYSDGSVAISFKELFDLSKSIATEVIKHEAPEHPVAVLTGRHVYTPACYLGIAMAGCFYAPMDPTVPEARLRQILGVVDAGTIITDEANLNIVKALGYSGNIIMMEDAIKTDADEEAIQAAMQRITETSPLYVLFTSGSTGKPKGVLTSHLAASCYLDGLQQVIKLNESDVLGNQAPLDYIAAIRDMYLPLMTGASTVILHPNEFAMPQNLFKSLSDTGVTTLCWSATGLEIPARLGVFDDPETILPPLNRVVFSGSVISNTLLRKWQDAFPETVFINQYGPTEATGSCSYQIIDHPVETDEILPIGKPYAHYKMLILKDDNTVATSGETGEICILGPALALGYHNAPDQTAKNFVINPAQTHYPELLYRTGDLGKSDVDGTLYFLGRKDRQFKHLGHRIEPEEIEQKAMQLDNIDEAVCAYNTANKTICLFYTGNASSKDIALFLRAELPSFMAPRKIVSLDEMPRLPNGKTDRKAIDAMASDM